MFYFFLVFYKINRVKLDFLHYGSKILDHILKNFSIEHSLGKVLTFLGATSKFKKLPTLLMTLLLLGNTACKSPKLENPCDPKTESNKNTILIKHFIGDTSAFCGINFSPGPILRYPGNTFYFPKGSEILPITPNVPSNLTSCVSNPSLPIGLKIDPLTCVISGTPTQITDTSSYTISASNAQGIGSTQINLGIHTTANNWVAISAPGATNQWQSVVFGNGQFVAVSATGTNRVISSPNASTWTAQTAAQDNNWQSVTYGNGLYVAVSSNGINRVMTSPDGITWTVQNASEANQWRSVTYGKGLFVAVARDGINRVMTSPDGVNWTARSASEASGWIFVTFGNGLFVAGAESGTNTVMTSPDGINWTSRPTPEANDFRCITYANGLFVAVNQTGTKRVTTSSDGILWTSRSATEANPWRSVTYANGLFVAVSSTGTNQVMTSPDGINWKAIAAAEANNWLAITSGNGVFVAVAVTGTNRVMKSSE